MMEVSTNAPILAVSGVTKGFRSGDRPIEVLRGVDLEVQPGESVSIRGASGCGKTTLLNILAGLEQADAGTVHWQGSLVRVADNGLNRRRGRFLGMVFQSFYLVPELTARENVLLAARVVGRLDRPMRERADALLERLGLAERAQSRPGTLSGGERQRVAVARALLNQPALVLADEPTGNLDEHTAATIMEALLEVCQEEAASLLLVTHSAAFAALTTRQTRLHDGQLAAVSPGE